MNYSKPLVTILGDASVLIEGCDKNECVGDNTGSLPTDDPAYELDE
jgi:hypothetical protein